MSVNGAQGAGGAPQGGQTFAGDELFKQAMFNPGSVDDSIINKLSAMGQISPEARQTAAALYGSKPGDYGDFFRNNFLSNAFENSKKAGGQQGAQAPQQGAPAQGAQGAQGKPIESMSTGELKAMLKDLQAMLGKIAGELERRGGDDEDEAPKEPKRKTRIEIG